jgi:hypothetical protein
MLGKGAASRNLFAPAATHQFGCDRSIEPVCEIVEWKEATRVLALDQHGIELLRRAEECNCWLKNRNRWRRKEVRYALIAVIFTSNSCGTTRRRPQRMPRAIRRPMTSAKGGERRSSSSAKPLIGIGAGARWRCITLVFKSALSHLGAQHPQTSMSSFAKCLPANHRGLTLNCSGRASKVVGRHIRTRGQETAPSRWACSICFYGQSWRTTSPALLRGVLLCMLGRWDDRSLLASVPFDPFVKSYCEDGGPVEVWGRFQRSTLCD